MTNPGAFSTFTVLWDYHLYLVLKHFIAPKGHRLPIKH